MANDADIRDSFPLFAQAYKDKRIFLSDLSYASPPADKTYQITVHDYPPVRLDRDGNHVDTPIYADPFTMQSGLITLEAGQTYVFGVKPLKKDARLYYRVLMSQTPWKPLTKAVTVQVPCSGHDSTYEFLFTSTGDRNKDGAELSVKRRSKQCCKSKRQDGESCPIESTSSGFILYPLFNPDTHGAMCPPGTHFSTIAAWCCPDGTQLDETVASEMSICCPTSADCSKDIVPNNLRCADPSWVLWTKAFRQVGCCMPGYVPNSLRYCVKDLDELGHGYSSIPQVGGAAQPTSMTTATDDSSSAMPTDSVDTSSYSDDTATGDYAETATSSVDMALGPAATTTSSFMTMSPSATTAPVTASTVVSTVQAALIGDYILSGIGGNP